MKDKELPEDIQKWIEENCPAFGGYSQRPVWKIGAEDMYRHLQEEKPKGMPICTDNDSKDYFPAECNECHFKGCSSKWTGGGQIADTGDYGDCYCPVCGGTSFDEFDGDEIGDQTELLLKYISIKDVAISDAEINFYNLDSQLSALRSENERLKGERDEYRVRLESLENAFAVIGATDTAYEIEKLLAKYPTPTT